MALKLFVSSKLPVPAVVQVPFVAPPPTVPDKATVAVEAGTVWFVPAFAVAAALMVTMTWAVAGPQGDV